MVKRPFINSVDRLSYIVKTERELLRLTQKDLAENAGVSVSFLSEIERGNPRAEVGKTLKILKALDVKPRSIPVTTQWAFDKSGALKVDKNGALKERRPKSGALEERRPNGRDS